MVARALTHRADHGLDVRGLRHSPSVA
jgi:hypothetical protein